MRKEIVGHMVWPEGGLQVLMEHRYNWVFVIVQLRLVARILTILAAAAASAARLIGWWEIRVDVPLKSWWEFYKAGPPHMAAISYGVQLAMARGGWHPGWMKKKRPIIIIANGRHRSITVTITENTVIFVVAVLAHVAAVAARLIGWRDITI